MARTAARLYVPLDANLFDDDKIVQAGEAATYLYVAMLARAKLLDTDGTLSVAQVDRLHIKNWQRRLTTLVAVGLIDEAPGYYGITGWLNWNESKAKRAERLKAERDRKATKKGDDR